MKNKIYALLMAFALALPLWGLETGEVDNVHLRDRSRYVSDMAGALTPAGLARADSLVGSIWRATTAEPAVVIVPELGDRDIDSYATELFEAWGIGKGDRDNGVLVLVSTGDRRATIRTGYGTEGVLPDAVAATIIRRDMAPHFRQGDYDGGLTAALQTMQQVMTSDAARQELLSQQANDSAASEGTSDGGFMIYLYFAMGVGGLMLIVLVLRAWQVRGKPTLEAYQKVDRLWVPYMTLACATLGMGLPAFLLLWALLRGIRLRRRTCPNCGERMRRLDEKTDNQYLTPVQDAEENLNSVDYDVWLCPTCGERDIIPYVNRGTHYDECAKCGGRTRTLVSDRVLLQPTSQHEGYGERHYRCRACGAQDAVRYNIPKVAAPPVVVMPGGRFGGGGGGGFSGGSFGGGSTGGGGASGGW